MKWNELHGIYKCAHFDINTDSKSPNLDSGEDYESVNAPSPMAGRKIELISHTLRIFNIFFLSNSGYSKINIFFQSFRKHFS